jgi:hypothetical protein
MAGVLPEILSMHFTNGQITLAARYVAGLDYHLWRTDILLPPAWQHVTNATTCINSNLIEITDPAAAAEKAFYRIQVTSP